MRILIQQEKSRKKEFIQDAGFDLILIHILCQTEPVDQLLKITKGYEDYLFVPEGGIMIFVPFFYMSV